MLFIKIKLLNMLSSYKLRCFDKMVDSFPCSAWERTM